MCRSLATCWYLSSVCILSSSWDNLHSMFLSIKYAMCSINKWVWMILCKYLKNYLYNRRECPPSKERPPLKKLPPLKDCPHSKKHLPPTFSPVFWIESKFIWMSAHPGSSFMWLIRVHSWSVEKHGMKHYALSEGRKLHIILYRRLALWCMGLRSLPTPRSRWYFAVQSGAFRQNVSFQGWWLCCTLLFVQYFREFVTCKHTSAPFEICG